MSQLCYWSYTNYACCIFLFGAYYISPIVLLHGFLLPLLGQHATTLSLAASLTSPLVGWRLKWISISFDNFWWWIIVVCAMALWRGQYTIWMFQIVPIDKLYLDLKFISGPSSVGSCNSCKANLTGHATNLGLHPNRLPVLPNPYINDSADAFDVV